ncbi:Peroxisome biogenesis protein 19-1 like [Verticillium longisporum]|uniref:Peroxisome biogenesis protein 19-1 like n=1 Tax=Verticillium longisporum TaxID=100787 RepID=A0A8I2ZR67_VERLO|nr:Peroxisome biogenesis protein 19-1 like [Verticillium longisporum]
MSDTGAVKAPDVEAKSAAAAAVEDKRPEPPVEDVPDPDEDDLDDLDDMLEEFSKKPAGQSTSGPASGPPPGTESARGNSGPDTSDKSLEDMFGDEEFAKQLQAGMSDLLGELEKNASFPILGFDDMFKSMAAATAQDATGEGARPGSSSGPAQPGASADAQAADASFQETIRRTMERMQASGDSATAAAADSSSDDFLAELMKQMGEGGGLDGAGGEEDFSKMLMGMMEQLTNKEILYEPMKELHDKFPEWMEKNKDKTPAEDLKRYQEQQVIVKEIVAKFEQPTYSDSTPADREYIVQRMQKMQDAGSPPSDLVGDMASAQEAFGAPDESCNPQ